MVLGKKKRGMKYEQHELAQLKNCHERRKIFEYCLGAVLTGLMPVISLGSRAKITDSTVAHKWHLPKALNIIFRESHWGKRHIVGPISLLQRRLRLGYTPACLLGEHIERMGVWVIYKDRHGQRCAKVLASALTTQRR